MLDVTRRDVLKALTAVSVGGVLPAGLSRLVFAAEPGDDSILIVVHLRGGCDGLQFVSPASDPDFIDARISDLRVTTDGKDAGFALAGGPDPHIDFRLHAAAGGLNELYQHGQLAFIHACGLTDATRSHFVATDMIEHGVGTESDLARIQTGWLARAFGATGGSNVVAVSVNGNVANDLEGMTDALAVPNLNNGLPFIGGPTVSTAIWSMYNGAQGPVADAGKRALLLPVSIDQHVARDAQGKIVPYQPTAGVNYNSAGGFADPLKTVARLIKMDIGLRVITVDYGSWDTHENQPGRFRGQIEPLSNGLAAFWNDIAAYQNRVTVVMVTEFGRRLRGNKSNGTDHGRGSLMGVLGGKIAGGKFHGTWPGLKSAQLDEGVDLAVTTDYRRVFSEVLTHTQGKADKNWFPDYKYPGPLGLYKT